MVFPVVGINRLSEYIEISKVVRFTYSGDLILDLGQKSIVELMVHLVMKYSFFLFML